MSPVLYYGLFSLLLATRVYTSCTTEKNLVKDKQETSCVSLGLTTIPLTDISKDTAILILSFNALMSVSTSTFKGLKQLVELDLSDNAMSSFKVDSSLMLKELNLANNSLTTVPKLSQLSRLTHLVLSNNRISTILDSAFKGLKKLSFLDLQKNVIDSLPEEVFKDLPLLDHLDLSYNQLWRLPEQLITGLDQLQTFSLTGNRLTDIPDGFFEDATNLAYVYLDKNPWNCNCALRYFKTWLEENEHAIYEISNGSQVHDVYTVLCSDGIPLMSYQMDHCFKAKGDFDLNTVPRQPKTVKPVKVAVGVPMTEKTTQPWITTLMATTEVGKTEKTTRAPTSTSTSELRTSTTGAEIGRTSTPVTEAVTTKGLETTWTTKAWRRSERTTKIPTTTAYQTILMTTTKVGRTTALTTEVATPTFHSTTKREPSMRMTTFLVSTQKYIGATTNVPTSEELTETSVVTPTVELTGIPQDPSYTMPPARDSQAAAFGMLWLSNTILKHCCFLHLLLYALCLLLLLVELIVLVLLLVWTYTQFYRHCQALTEKLPRVRLIRYSLRAPMNEEEILLVQNGTIESQFRDQSSSGVTRMVVLEAGSRHQERRCTSAIL